MKKIVWIVLISILGVQAIFWIISGLLAVAGESPQSLAIALLMILDGVVFGLLALLCRKGRLIVKFVTLIFLFANLVLTFTDQMGTIDIAVLVLNIIALSCCLYLFISGNANRRVR